MSGNQLGVSLEIEQADTNMYSTDLANVIPIVCLIFQMQVKR